MKGLHSNSLRKVDNPHQWMIDDARMELIQQIKAEVKRLIKECDGSVSQYGFGKESACNRILNFLDTLQEQPVKIDIRKELASIEFMGVNDARDSETIARHFYELGRQSKPTTAEGFNEEFHRWLKGEIKEHFGFPSYGEYGLLEVARHFAQWGAEHLDK